MVNDFFNDPDIYNLNKLINDHGFSLKKIKRIEERRVRKEERRIYKKERKLHKKEKNWQKRLKVREKTKKLNN